MLVGPTLLVILVSDPFFQLRSSTLIFVVGDHFRQYRSIYEAVESASPSCQPGG
jgi:hypothetical protein